MLFHLKITKLYYACIVIVVETDGLTSRKNPWVKWTTTQNRDPSGNSNNANPLGMSEPVVSYNSGLNNNFQIPEWNVAGNPSLIDIPNQNPNPENPWERSTETVANNWNSEYTEQGWGDQPETLNESNQELATEISLQQDLETYVPNTEDIRTSFQGDGSWEWEQSSQDNAGPADNQWSPPSLPDSGDVTMNTQDRSNENSQLLEVSTPLPEAQLRDYMFGFSKTGPETNLNSMPTLEQDRSGQLSKLELWSFSKNQPSSIPFSGSEELLKPKRQWPLTQNTQGSFSGSVSRQLPQLFQNYNLPPDSKLDLMSKSDFFSNPSKPDIFSKPNLFKNPGLFSKPKSVSNSDRFSMTNRFTKLDPLSPSDPLKWQQLNMNSMLMSGSFSKRARGPSGKSISDLRNSLLVKNVRNRKDLPLTGDLPIYLKALRRIIYSRVTRRSEMDLNLEFGLFLTQVNLEYSMRKAAKLDKKNFDLIKTVKEENKRCLSYLHDMVLNDKNSSDTTKKISSLFSNTTTWLRLAKSFQFKDETFQRYVDEFQTKYSSWGQYENDIDNLNKWTPNPGQSDICMASLYDITNNHGSRRNGGSRKCINTLEKCDDVIQYGSDFGYALTHRLVYLMIAKYSRGCNALPVDNVSIEDICMKAYAESLFIEANKYKNIDLLLEQSCLCGFEGYSLFLRRSIMIKTLQFQSPQGCFCMKPWSKYNKGENFCNGHVTSVAAATLSTAIRFIIESYHG